MAAEQKDFAAKPPKTEHQDTVFGFRVPRPLRVVLIAGAIGSAAGAFIVLGAVATVLAILERPALDLRASQPKIGPAMQTSSRLAESPVGRAVRIVDPASATTGSGSVDVIAPPAAAASATQMTLSPAPTATLPPRETTGAGSATLTSRDLAPAPSATVAPAAPPAAAPAQQAAAPSSSLQSQPHPEWVAPVRETSRPMTRREWRRAERERRAYERRIARDQRRLRHIIETRGVGAPRDIRPDADRPSREADRNRDTRRGDTRLSEERRDRDDRSADRRERATGADEVVVTERRREGRPFGGNFFGGLFGGFGGRD